MLDQLDSLIVFSHSSSMAEAAGRLRISQSALSKRLAILEAALGYPLLEYKGRRAILTNSALTLLTDLEPTMAKLKDILHTSKRPSSVSLSIAMADAIMVSWGATLMVRLKASFPEVDFDVHSHRTTTIIERLSRGQYQIGLCTGKVRQTSNLIVQPLAEEPMALIVSPQHSESFEKWCGGLLGSMDVICIEQNSAMWSWLEPWFKSWQLNPAQTIESSVGAARLAIEGYGHALVPEGVAKVIAQDHQWFRMDANLKQDTHHQTLARPCSLVSRKAVLNHAAYRKIFDFIAEQVSELIAV